MLYRCDKQQVLSLAMLFSDHNIFEEVYQLAHVTSHCASRDRQKEKLPEQKVIWHSYFMEYDVAKS